MWDGVWRRPTSPALWGVSPAPTLKGKVFRRANIYLIKTILIFIRGTYAQDGNRTFSADDVGYSRMGAGSNQWNVFFGYSYEHTPIIRSDSSSFNGWDASLEGKFLPWIGLVADIDGHYGSHNYFGTNANITSHNALFGPRVSASVGRFRPFGEFLIGVAHISRSAGFSDSDTSFADAVGGGLDYRVFGPFTVRGQLDWISTRFYSNTQNGVRFSTGIALHF